MSLSRFVKVLGVFGFVVCIISYLYLTHVLIMNSIGIIASHFNVPKLMVERYVMAMLSMLYAFSIIGFLVGWVIYAAILHGFLKAFKIDSKFGTTFLLSGHYFYASTISILLTYWTLITNSSYLTKFVLYRTMPVEVYAYGIVFTIIIASIYVALLLSREYNTSMKKVLIATIITNTILYTLGQIITTTYKPTI